MVPFVGREKELELLAQHWRRAQAGEPQHLLIAGDAGIGKTRLVDELVAAVRGDQTQVLRGRGWDGDVGGAPAYWPWTQALGSYLEQRGPEALAPLAADLDPSIVRLLPRLRPALPAPAAHDAGGAQTAQLRLFEAAGLLLRRMAGQGPVLLVLDDLEAADPQSVLLLRFLVRARSAGRCLVLGVYRTPLTRGAETTLALESIRRDPGVVFLTLDGLTAPQLGTIVQAMTGGTASVAMAAALHLRTGGNPLFASEFLRLLSPGTGQSGSLLANEPLPLGVREVIDRRLVTLPDRCRDLLKVAAVAGTEVNLGVLARVADESTDSVLGALAPALEAGVLVPVPERPMRQTFSHPLLRESLASSLHPLVRAELHRKVADALRERFAAVIEDHLDAIARHYVAAAPVGSGPLALEFCRQAARRAGALAARDEAVRMLELALEVLPLMEASRELNCEVLLELGDAQTRAGRRDEARATFLRVAEQAERLQQPALLARAALGYAGRFVWGRAAPDSREARLLETALAALPGDQPALQARVLARLAGMHRDQREARDNLERCRRAVALACKADDPEALVSALSAQAFSEFGAGTTESQAAAAAELMRAAREAGDLEQQWQAHVYRAGAHFEAGEGVAGEAEVAACVRLGQTLGQPPMLWYITAAQSFVELVHGRLDRAEALSAEALRIGKDVQPLESRSNALVQSYFIRREQGRLAELEPQLTGALTSGLAVIAALAAHLAAELGRLAEARVFLDRQVSNDFADVRDSLHFRYILTLVAETAARTGHEAAGEAAGRLLADVTQRHVLIPPAGNAGSILRYRGLCAAAAGRQLEAARWLREAAAENRKAGVVIFALRSELDLSRVLLQQARPPAVLVTAAERDQALALLRAVAAEAADRGLLTIAGEATRLAASVRAEPAPQPVRGEAAGASEPPAFRHEGEFWTIQFFGSSIRIRDVKGMRYLGHLLANEGREVPALELLAAEGPGSERGPSEAEPMRPSAESEPVLDTEARARFKQRLLEINSELDEAQQWNDSARAARLSREREALTQELAAAMGLGGRGRRAGAPAERARQSVTKAIKSAIHRIADEHALLGRHLEATVFTGLLCEYRPDPQRRQGWQVEL